jgi:hypothetical protein
VRDGGAGGTGGAPDGAARDGTPAKGGTSGTSDAGGTSGTSDAGGTSGTSDAGGTSGTSDAGGTSGTSDAGGAGDTNDAGGAGGAAGSSQDAAATGGTGGTNQDAGTIDDASAGRDSAENPDLADASGPVSHTLVFTADPQNYRIDTGTDPTAISVTSQSVGADGALTLVVHCGTPWTGLAVSIPTRVDLTNQSLKLNGTATAIGWGKLFTQGDPDWTWNASNKPAGNEQDISFSWDRGAGTAWPVQNIGVQLGCDGSTTDVTWVIRSFTYSPL